MQSALNSLQIRPIHPFPARMAPAIVWEELLSAGATGPLRVLDPMAGSGTTIATARLLGHEAIGFDTDPLAVLIASAWSADVKADALRDTASGIVDEARLRARHLSTGESYPRGADEETRAFVRYWFDLTARRHLTALASTIKDVKDRALRSLLWCSFSRLIVVKSSGASLAIDVAHSRPHRVYELSPLKPLAAFLRAATVVALRSPFHDGMERPTARVRRADARKLPMADCAADFLITSPPYLNAIDYLRGHKLSLVWMGHTVGDLRQIRATNLGTEVSAPSAEHESDVERVLSVMGELDSLPDRDVGMLRRYVRDMNLVMRETARVLAPTGRAVFVIGDSTLRNVFVRNSAALTCLGELNGLRLISRRCRPLPPNRRYLPPPCSVRAGKKLENRMRDEVILSFSRSA